MEKNIRGLLLVLALCTLMIAILPVTASANSAEPPSLVILVNNPPDDLSIVLLSDENQPEATVRRAAWEGYYVFYAWDMRNADEYRFRVTAKGESFECTLDAPTRRYNNVATLDISDRELTPGEYPYRAVLLVSIRLLLTLLLEGVIFWLFAFRQKRSWLIFLIANLVTQGALNIWLNNEAAPLSSYLIFTLIVGEIVVFAAEMIAMPIFIKEHKKGRVLICTFAANLVSLVAGGYLITVLPV